MRYSETIKKMNLLTSKGEELNTTDYLYIDHFISAIKRIQQRYLKRPNPFSGGIAEEVVEREYSSELKTLVYSMFQENNPESNPLGLLCDHEGSKTYSTKAWDVLCTEDRYPDIIIHKGDSPKDGIQELVCEIKRLSQLGADNMLLDLNKLLTISGTEIWEGHGYRIPVFLVSNGAKSQLFEKCGNFRNNKHVIVDLLSDENTKEEMTFAEYVTKHQERLKNILCICHSEEGKVEVCTVYDVAKSKIMH